MALISQAEDAGGGIDIVCGSLCSKLLTRDLSCGSSRCVSHGADLLTPCEFECLAGRSTSRNWKTSIRFRGKPLSNFLESYL